MTNPLYICYASSDYYARETGISLIGFFENNKDYEPEEVLILDYGILENNKIKLNGIAESYGRKIKYLPAKQILEEIQRELNLKDFRGSLATYSRAFIDQIIPEYVKRLFYIDSDTVVVGSISQLNTFKMDDACMAGVVSLPFTKMMNKGIFELYSGNKYYYGCGCVLFDLDNWRNRDCYQKIVRILNTKKEFPCADQTLINNSLEEDNLKKLPLKYNYTTHLLSKRYEKDFILSGNLYSKEEYFETITKPIVVHYPGREIDRPWYEHCISRRASEYYKYKMMSPWADTPLYENSACKKGLRNNFSAWIHSLENNNNLYTTLKVVNFARSIIGNILRSLGALPKLPNEGIE